MDNNGNSDTVSQSRLIRHFGRYKKRRPWSFCWRITVEGLIVALAAAFLLHLLFLLPPEGRNLHNARVFFINCVLMAPVIETFIGQAFPIFVARVFRASFRMQVFLSMVIFAVPHFGYGIGTGICAGLVGGFYFGFTYAHWRQKSRWTAFWITALSHSLHNGFALVLLLMLGGFK